MIHALSLFFMSRLQKVETRNLQLAGTGERLMISNGYNRHNARSPVPARKNLLFAGDSYNPLLYNNPKPGPDKSPLKKNFLALFRSFWEYKDHNKHVQDVLFSRYWRDIGV